MASPLNPALKGLSRGKQFLDKQIGDRFVNYFENQGQLGIADFLDPTKDRDKKGGIVKMDESGKYFYDPSKEGLDKKFGYDLPQNLIKNYFPSQMMMGSEQVKAEQMDKMNGRSFDNGDVSQGSQEQDQSVMLNKQAAANQFLADASRKLKNTRGETTYDGRPLVEGPKGDLVDPNFLKLIQGRPDLYEKYMAGEDIFGDAPEMKNPYMGT